MSLAAANGIRVDQVTQKGSVHDVVHLIYQKPGASASQTFLRLEKAYPELTPNWCKFKIDYKGCSDTGGDCLVVTREESS